VNPSQPRDARFPPPLPPSPRSGNHSVWKQRALMYRGLLSRQIPSISESLSTERYATGTQAASLLCSMLQFHLLPPVSLFSFPLACAAAQVHRRDGEPAGAGGPAAGPHGVPALPGQRAPGRAGAQGPAASGTPPVPCESSGSAASGTPPACLRYASGAPQLCFQYASGTLGSSGATSFCSAQPKTLVPPGPRSWPVR